MEHNSPGGMSDIEVSDNSVSLSSNQRDSATQVNWDWDERRKLTQKIDSVLPKHSLKEQYTSKFYVVLLRHRPLQMIISYFLTVILIVVGGFIFHKCEYNHYNDLLYQKNNLISQVDDIILRYGISAEDVATLNEWESNKILTFNPWEIRNATYFAFQIVSTVGYGFWMPLTFAGQLAVVIYGIPGIILFLICCFHYSVSWVGVIFDYITFVTRRSNILKLEWLNNRLDHDVYTSNLALIMVFYSFQFMVLAVFYALSYPAWTFWEAVYFVFISGSTIGMSHIYPDIDWSIFAGGLIFHCYLMNLGMCLTLFQQLESMLKLHMQKSHDNIVLVRLQELERSKLESKTNDVLEILEKLKSSKKLKRMSAMTHEINFGEAKKSLQMKIEEAAVRSGNRRLSSADALHIARGKIPKGQEVTALKGLKSCEDDISSDVIELTNYPSPI